MSKISQNGESFGIQALLETAVFFFFFIYLFNYLRKGFTAKTFLDKWSISEQDGLDIACKLVSGLFAVWASLTGVYLMMREQELINGIAMPFIYTNHIFLFVIAYFHYDLYAMFVVFQGSVLEYLQSKPLMIVHHLAIGAFFTPMMMSRMDHDPGDLMIACALIFEASTPFVSIRAILAHLNLKKSMAYVVNGLMMVIVFFSCRILVYPWFYVTYARLRNISFWKALATPPLQCNFFLILALLPQLHWFNIMLKGAFKVVRDMKEPDVCGDQNTESKNSHSSSRSYQSEKKST